MTIIESRIDSVRVHHSGATVCRIATLVPTEGRLPPEVEVQQLPLSLLDPTVRVRVEQVEPAAAEVLATDARVGLHALTPEQAPEEPDEARLKAVQRRVLATRTMLGQIELESAYLRGMRVPERPEGEEGKPPPASPTAARVALEQFVDDAVQQRTQEVRELRAELKRLLEEEAELEEKLSRASDARMVKPHDLRKTIVVRIVARGTTPVASARLVIEYFVPGARWAPAYQCRLARDCQAAELQLRALVCQRSGEDWRNVKLVLSTASPLTWTELPELASIRIGRAQPAAPTRRGFRPPPRGATALFADYDRDRARAGTLLPPAPGWSAPALYAAPPAMVPDAGGFEESASTPSQSGAELEKASYRPAPMPGMAPPAQPSFACADSFAEPAPAVEEAAMLTAEFETMPSELEAPPPPPAAPAASRGATLPPQAIARRPAPRMAARAKERRRMREEVTAIGAPPEIAGAAEGILFTGLRLAEPTAPERNRLVPLDVRETYLRSLERARLRVEIDLFHAVGQAQHAAAAIASLPLPEGSLDVRRSAGYFDYSYEADARVDLESDGAFHSLALGSRAAKSEVRYIVVPREEASAYRMATLTNPLSAPLLPGPVEVHVGGDYVLTTSLPTVAPGGQFQLGLGVEQAIKVARNTHFAERRSGTKVVAMTELLHSIEVELASHLERPIRCEVRERIPHPAPNAEVVVEEAEVQPAWEVYTQRERGAEIDAGRRWLVEIEAGGRAKLRAGYVVKIYANNEVVGGNRREA